jgi:putative glutamine amidotransferase
MKPLIGINLDIKAGPPEEAAIQTPYTEAILKSGGIPILLPPMPREDLREVLRRLDGLMLIGGLIIVRVYMTRSPIPPVN